MKPRKASTLALLVGSFLVSAALMTAQPATQAIDNWSAPPLWIPGQAVTRELSGDGLAPLGEQAIEALPTSPLPFVGITPCRLVDTRPGAGFSGQYGPPALVANSTRDFDLDSAPHCPGVPVGAQAYSLNVTVTGTQGVGDLRIWPTGSFALVSTQNWPAAGVTLANAAIVPAGTNGSITVQAAGSGTHLIIDINGYYFGTVVTQVVAGTGMTGGGIGSVALGIANGGVGNAQLAGGSVSSDKVALPLLLQKFLPGAVLAGINGGGGVGVLGGSTGGSGIGVSGQGAGTGVEGLSGTGIGVYGSGDNGYGVYGNSVGDGLAMRAQGTAVQQRDRGGWVKALVRASGATLSRCFNSQATTRSAAESCAGFSISGAAANYTITFPFNVDDRFVHATVESTSFAVPGCCMVQYDFPAANQVRIHTWDGNGFPLDRPFSIVIF